MCNINDPRILNAYIAITEEEPTDWYSSFYFNYMPCYLLEI